MALTITSGSNSWITDCDLNMQGGPATFGERMINVTLRNCQKLTIARPGTIQNLHTTAHSSSTGEAVLISGGPIYADLIVVDATQAAIDGVRITSDDNDIGILDIESGGHGLVFDNGDRNAIGVLRVDDAAGG